MVHVAWLIGREDKLITCYYIIQTGALIPPGNMVFPLANCLYYADGYRSSLSDNAMQSTDKH